MELHQNFVLNRIIFLQSGLPNDTIIKFWCLKKSNYIFALLFLEANETALEKSLILDKGKTSEQPVPPVQTKPFW